MVRKSLRDAAFGMSVEDKDRLFERAVDEFGLPLLKFFKARVNDFQLAEDLTQMLWLHVYQKFPPEKFSHLPLLYRKARQVLIDELRKRGVRNFVETWEELPDSIQESRIPEPASSEEEMALQERFWENFPEIPLSDSQKRAFWLKERYGYTFEEVAKKMDIPKSTIADWVSQTKSACAAYINSMDES